MVVFVVAILLHFLVVCRLQPQWVVTSLVGVVGMWLVAEWCMGRAKRTRAERLRVPSCPFQRQKRLAQAPMSFIFNQSKILGTIDRIPCIPNTGCPQCLSTVWIQCVSIFFRKCVNIVRILYRDSAIDKSHQRNEPSNRIKRWCLPSKDAAMDRLAQRQRDQHCFAFSPKALPGS